MFLTKKKSPPNKYRLLMHNTKSIEKKTSRFLPTCNNQRALIQNFDLKQKEKCRQQTNRYLTNFNFVASTYLRCFVDRTIISDVISWIQKQ